MNGSKRIFSGVFWSLILNIINALYGFVAVPVLIKYFGKSEYGLIGIAMSVNVYMQLMDMGFNNTNVRFFSVWLSEKKLHHVQKLFSTSLAFYGTIGAINSILLIIVALCTSYIFNITPEQADILRHLFLILSISAFVNWYTSCFEQIIKGTENVAWIQKINIMPKLLLIIVLFSTVYLKLDIKSYYALTVFSAFSVIPIQIAKIKKLLPFVSFKPAYNIDILKEIFPYCMNIFSFSIFQFSFQNLRPVLLGVQSTPESITDYQVLNSFATLILVVGNVFMNVLVPSTSRIVAQRDKNAFFKVAYQGTKYVTIVLGFCIFGLITISNELMILYVGNDYLYLIPWMTIWVLALLGNHNYCISSLILAGSNIKALARMSAFSSVVGIILTILLIPIFGVGGTVIAFLAYVILQALFFYTYYWPRKMQIDSFRVLTKSFLPSVIVGTFTLFIIKLIDFDYSSLVNLIIKGSLFAFIYVAVQILLLNRDDRDFIKNIFLK